MNPDATADLPGDQRSLASTLAPLLRDACEGRLGEIAWFKADWQRGGAATGIADYQNSDGATVQVVLKLPVVQRELTWMRRLQSTDDPSPIVPRLYASGEELGGYDLAWIVIEHLPHGPLGLRWHADHVPRIAKAAARFQKAAKAFPVDQPGRTEPWDEMLRESLEIVRINPVEEQARWIAAVKKLRANLDPLVTEWRARPVDEWQHGDLHIANAMSRISMETGEVCLIDLAEVHAGHWLEDAVYLERQLWARPERMKPLKPVKAIANARKQLGLPVESDYPRLAMIRRALLA
ncbi:MAG: aminoglycoside phosphotransferase family protein, partial [Phycisphaerales bacterium]